MFCRVHDTERIGLGLGSGLPQSPHQQQQREPHLRPAERLPCGTGCVSVFVAADCHPPQSVQGLREGRTACHWRKQMYDILVHGPWPGMSQISASQAMQAKVSMADIAKIPRKGGNCVCRKLTICPADASSSICPSSHRLPETSRFRRADNRSPQTGCTTKHERIVSSGNYIMLR